jgi:hypothetical protein
MRNLTLITLRYLCASVLFIGTCHATEQEPVVQPETSSDETENQSKYKPAGNRALLPSETLAIKQQLAAEEAANAQENPVESAVGKVQAGIKLFPSTTPKASYYYYTTHTGALHQPMALWDFGSTVELEDGSLWSISSSDSYKTLNWLTTDIVIVTPNHEWFSIYNYCLVNQNTGVTVRANLSKYLDPYFHTSYNYRIIAIDDILQQVWLSDGSVWSIVFGDYSTRWQLNDTVIIGINDGWLSSSRPNILINANILHHVRANCIY